MSIKYQRFMFTSFVILGSLFGSYVQGAALSSSTNLALQEKFEQMPSDVLTGFDSADVLETLSFKGDFTGIELNTDGAFVKVGPGSLKISCEDAADGRIGGRPTLNMRRAEPLSLSDYQAVMFWLYVAPEDTEYFFGRYDVAVYLGKERKVRTHWSAIVPGWNMYIWQFDAIKQMPDIDNVLFQFGPLLEGYETAEFYLDEITFIKMDDVPSGSDLASVALTDDSWSRRYNAIEALAQTNAPEALQVFIRACGDVSPTIRTLAVDVMSEYVGQHGAATTADLEKGMADSNWRVRLAVLELITKVEAALGAWAQEVLHSALFDDNYYVRHHALNHLLGKGLSKADVAKKVAPALLDSDPRHRQAAIRMLCEIGPRAENVLPQLLGILRDTDNDLLLRCWALRAVWEIDEDVLQPKDWLLALNLEPGQIHRHLLNRAMDRLEIAGADAVPALISALHADDPQVVTRACAILGSMGNDAGGAVVELQRVVNDPRWYVGWEANEALEKILPHYRSSSPQKQSRRTEADVTVSRSGTMTTITNGLLELVFEDGDDNPGPQIVRTPGGKNVVHAPWLPKILAFRYSKSPNMIERQWFQRIFGCPFPRTLETRLVSATPDAADYMIKFVGDEVAFLDWEFHYVLRKGDPGFYSYFVIKNLSGREIPKETKLSDQGGIGRINYLFGLTWGMYEYNYMHDKLKGPAAFFRIPNEYAVEDYPDIYQSAFRLPDGRLAAKHEWHNYELFSHVSGFTGPNGGIWMIFPSFDFFGGSMPRQINTQNQGSKFLPMLEGKYYSGVTAHVTKDWQKTYGPMYFYINDGANPEEMWIDAKRQAEAEKAKWPYPWLDTDEHHDRGAIKGVIKIADGSSPQGAYVVLSNPNDPVDPDQISLWMRNCGAYNYWTEVAEDGSFRIENIHSGSYGLYVFKPGIFGELDHGRISIACSQIADAGELILTPEQNGRLIWQIGIPDGGMMEFKNGRNYHQWDNYIRYREDFPNDVRYVIGTSDWSQDWNYMHPATVQGESKPVNWTIEFELAQEPVRGHLLTIVCAGRYAHAQALLNRQQIGKLDVSIGANHARTCPYGELVQKEFTISPDLLNAGKNTILLTFDMSKEVKEGLTEAPAATHNLKWTSWLAYDFIRLEELK